jgi:hypothetical protein
MTANGEQKQVEGLDLSTELAIGALALASMGVVHGWIYYQQFGVNIFDYIGPTDFVVFALKDPGAVAMVVLVAVVSGLWLWRRRVVLMLVVLAASALISYAAAVRDAADVLSGDVRVSGRPPCKIIIQINDKTETVVGATVLGNAGGFIAYYKDRSTYLVRADKILHLACPSR